MGKLKVIIVDNSAPYKRILTQAVENTGLGQVKGTFHNVVSTLERLKSQTTDVVLMDMLIPQADWMETLSIIKREYPDVYVVPLGDEDSTNPEQKKAAMEAGALDLIVKPKLTNLDKSLLYLKNQLQGIFTQIITEKYTSSMDTPYKVVSPDPVIKPASVAEGPEPQETPHKKVFYGVDLILIASSTGGTGALETICKRLPPGFNKPILVVQHMPAEMTRNLAQSLSKKSMLPVVEAEEGDQVQPGRVLIARGGVHTLVRAARQIPEISLESSAPVHGVRPAADVLFYSVAKVYRGKRILAVILTGMGNDGALGVRELKKSCDCYCITQSEKTCVVYGMPRSVVEAGLSDAAEDLDDIPASIVRMAEGRS